MRTSIDIDDTLLEEAFAVAKARTKTELVQEALREFVKLRRRKDLTDLSGFIEFHPDYDHKSLRRT